MASEGNGTPLTRLTQRLPVRVLPEPRIQSNSSPALDGPNRQIRIVLLGKTGVGKSSLGNLLLHCPHDQKLFQARKSPKSVTTECSKQSIAIDAEEVVVVDTPGFFDTEAIREESKKKLVKQTKDTILDMKPGPHVFLIVMEPTRFTSQEVQCLEMIKKLFDGDIFKHVVVVFTKADQLDDTTITEYLSEAPAELTSFLEQCGKRYVSINASPKELSERHTNRKEVMKLINDLIAQNNNSYFTSRLLAEVNKVLKMNKEGVGRFQQIKPRPNATTVELGSDAETMKEVESIIEHHISSVLEKK